MTREDLLSRFKTGAYDITTLRRVAKNLDYALFDKGNINLNIWGIRCDVDDTDTFNDLLLVFYKRPGEGVNPNLAGKWRYDFYSITTDPSTASLIKPINSRGCAVLVEGQFRSAFKLGKHKGDYDALVQAKPLPLYRIKSFNGNLNKAITECPIKDEIAGINIHRASKWKISRMIGLYSAGCQVFESVRDYEDKFMPLIKAAAEKYGNMFTYTLVNINDFK